MIIEPLQGFSFDVFLSSMIVPLFILSFLSLLIFVFSYMSFRELLVVALGLILTFFALTMLFYPLAANTAFCQTVVEKIEKEGNISFVEPDARDTGDICEEGDHDATVRWRGVRYDVPFVTKSTKSGAVKVLFYNEERKLVPFSRDVFSQYAKAVDERSSNGLTATK